MTPRLKTFADVDPPPTAHAGLWFDKYIADQKATETRRKLVDQVARIGEPAGYAAFFSRWQAGLTGWQAGRPGEDLLLARAYVCGRMAVGLGAESVLETSLRLHHTWGVPYIPGSALKGLARSYALHHLDQSQWGAQSDAFKVVFGIAPEPGDPDQEEDETAASASFGAGYVTFFDALYIPKSGVSGRALHADVLTVHHKAYYEGQNAAPADWDSPVPVPFLTATGAYLIALGGPGDWVLAAYQILEKACAELGVGAKTSSGYGRLKLSRDLNAPLQEAAAARIATRLPKQPAQPASTQPTPSQPVQPTPGPAAPPLADLLPQTVFPNAKSLPAEATAPVPPVVSGSEWRQAIVLKYSPLDGKGRLQDVVTKEEFEFAKAARVGGDWMPKRDLPVEYQRDPKQPGRAASVRLPV